eukprot:TRINITY_DN22996_c0_g1_i1.p1 TRINITY_DN22996_c0_g1~~TRINITY_DN22996_c0_g1_i1.p1  ORF type:complete len:278 (+),score=106.89 TRINITY_DN22996_c0_g1_i1:111-836(+)
MPEVDRVLLVWNNVDESSVPPPAAHFNCEAPVVVLRQERNEVENRLLQAQHVRTPCVLQLDDDLFVPLADVRMAFRTWLGSPQQLVGFAPRIHYEVARGRWKYDRHVDGSYSMVIGSAIFLHRSYHELYAGPSPTARTLREYVRREACCDDIVLNALASHHSGLPPLYVRSDGAHELKTRTEGGWRGKSKQRGWNAKRSAAVGYVISVFGEDPFKVNDIVVQHMQPTPPQSVLSWIISFVY